VSRLRLMLSDEGEGWPDGAPDVFGGTVVGEAPDVISGRFLKVEFDEPVRLPGSDLVSGAWIKEHFVGDAVGAGRAVSVYVWLVVKSVGWGATPQSSPDLWARCQVTA